MAKPLTRQFSHAFAGVVWNMTAGDSGRYLILEVRDHEAHTVSFAALALPEGRLIWQGLHFNEPWWAKVQAVKNGVALFYIFDGNMEPETRELYALDILTQKNIWHKSDLEALFQWEDNILCATGRGDKKQFLQVNFRSGEQKQVDGDFARRRMSELSGELKNKSSILPLHYPEGNNYFGRFRQFLKEKLQVDAVKACDYLARENRIVISYYIYTGDPSERKSLANYLLVVDEKGSVLFHEKIQDAITAVGMETFFILNDQLIFVRNKKEINSYGI